MQKFKHILKSIFCLSPFLTVIIALPSFALVIYDNEKSTFITMLLGTLGGLLFAILCFLLAVALSVLSYLAWHFI